MAMSFLVTVSIHFLKLAGIFNPGPDAALLWTVGITTAFWILITYLTPAVDREVLANFVHRIRPAGPGWNSFTTQAGTTGDNLPRALLSWTLGCTFVYAALFATGSFLYGRTGSGSLLGAIALVTGYALNKLLRSNQSDS